MHAPNLAGLILVALMLLSPAAIPRSVASPTVLRLETGSGLRPTEAAQATERCVSLLRDRALAAADGACNRAVVAAERDRSESWNAPFSASAAGQEVAVAYNNRAVFNYLAGRLASAAADAARARSAASLPAIDDTAAAIQAARRRTTLRGD